MPNLNLLAIPASEFRTTLIVPTSSGSKTFAIQSAKTISRDVKIEGQLGYAIGSTDAIYNQSNGRSVEGKFTLLTGELNSICSLCGFPNATYIQGATIAIVAIVGAFSLILRDVNFNSDSFTIEAKSKETLSNIDYMALSDF